MLSEKQLQANRANAQKSTGPRTAAGKAASSQNALTHGLCSGRVVTAGEDRQEYESFRKELFSELAPVGILEERLADQAAAALWKLRRLTGLEPRLLDNLSQRQKKKKDDYAERVLAAEKKIRKTRSLYESVLQARRTPIHRVSFDDAKEAWLKTEDGMACTKAIKADDPEAKYHMKKFGKFWAELDQKAVEQDRQKTQPNTASQAQSDQAECLSMQIARQQRQAAEARARDSAGSSPLQQADVDVAKSPQGSDESVHLVPALVDDFTGSNVLLKFGRYQTQAERSVYRVLSELNRLQSNRKRNESIEVRAVESNGKECA